MADNDYHKTYRHLIEHEDKLIADRNTWCVLSQSFLFISLALSLSAMSDSNELPELKYFATTFQTVIIVVGLTLSTATFLSVLAALLAIKKLSDDWREMRKTTQSEQSDTPRDPKTLTGPEFVERKHLTGGGSSLSRALGYVSPTLISVAFIGAWGYIACQYWWSLPMLDP